MRGFVKAAGEYGIHALVLLALLTPVFPGVFLRGEVAFPGNFIYVRPPWSEYRPADLEPQSAYLETPIQATVWYALTTTALKRGEWPLWNPFQFTGVPLLGVYQTAIFYPPRLIFLLVNDLFTAFTLFILFKIWLAGMTAFVCARGLGIGGLYARFFSIAYMLGGYVLTWNCYPTTDSMGWAPILLLGIERLVAGRMRSGFAFTFIASVLMLLAAGAQHTLTFCMMLGAYFLIRLAETGAVRRAVKLALTALAAGLLAVGVCAIQLLPFLEYLTQSVSVLDAVFNTPASTWRYKPADAVALWAPRYFGSSLHGNSWGELNPYYLSMAYIGIPVWLCAALAFRTGGLSRDRRRQLAGLGIVTMIAFLFAARSPGISLILDLPLLNTVRPVYFLSFAALALPLIAAISLQHWSDARRRPLEILPAMAFGVAILSALWLHFTWSRPELSTLEQVIRREGSLFSLQSLNSLNVLPLAPQQGTLTEYVRRQIIWSAVMVALSLTGLGLALWKRIPAQSGAWMLTAVLAFDLVSAAYGHQPMSKRAHVFPETALTNYLRAQGHPFRVSFVPTYWVGYPTVYEIEELTGHDAYVPRRYHELTDRRLDLHSSLRPAYAIDRTLFIAPKEGELRLPESHAIDRLIDGIVVSREVAQLPRARLANSLAFVESLDELQSRVEQPGFDVSREVLSDAPSARHAPAATDGPAGSARVVEWGWNRVAIDVDATAECVLVLADAYYPGWEARIEATGEELEIFPAYHLFRGVIVPAGPHRIEIQYRPLSFRVGAVISVVTLMILLLASLFALRTTGKPDKASCETAG